MRGIESTCCECGASGFVLGCPSFWYDRCRDREACLRRQLERAEQKAKEKVEK